MTDRQERRDDLPPPESGPQPTPDPNAATNVDTQPEFEVLTERYTHDDAVLSEAPQPPIDQVPQPAAERPMTPKEARQAEFNRKANQTVIRIRPMARPARFRLRHKFLILAFLLLVLAPLGAATWYLEDRAAPQFASTVAFTVRSEESTGSTDILGGIGLGATLGGEALSDASILYEFIGSQEIVGLLDARLDLRALYSRHAATDPVFSFAPGGTIEDLTRYWRRMVTVSFDEMSGLMELRVLAFDPEEAQTVATAIYEESTRMINELSAIAREDALRYAREDLEIAVERLREARSALTAFRIENQIVDVNADIQGQMGLLNNLQGQLAETLIELDLLENVGNDNDPRLAQTKNRITVIEARIEEERRKLGQGVGGESDGFATTLADFERLSVDRQFAEQAYLLALTAFDTAAAKANRQSRYLATYIRPTVAERSEYPSKFLLIGLIGIFGFLIWAIVSLIYYALRDRR
jgi:capsular polysaccharide transport system permease protein